MQILKLRVLRGPNYWSSYRRQLIDMELDLRETEDQRTDQIKAFAERLEALMPTLYEHRCSETGPGGFFDRVRRGTRLGHVVEHVALELQSLADMPCGFGRTRSSNKKGIYHVVFAYELETAGVYAARAAVRIVGALSTGQDIDIAEDIRRLGEIHRREGLGPSTLALVNEAKKRNIPFRRLDKQSLIILGQGCHQKLVRATVTSNTGCIGVDLAGDKDRTRAILSRAFVPLPEGVVVSGPEELEEAVNKIGFPLVIKPIDGNHGRGVKVNITRFSEAVCAFQAAREYSSKVIVERFVDGHDYRFLVINFKLQAVARRTPAAVTGDGISTISQLIGKANADPQRGEGHEKRLTAIKIDAPTQSILRSKNLSLDSVLPFGEILFLKDAANLSAGGTATDVTDTVHPYNVALAERIARLMNLDICGIDMIIADLSSPITAENGAVIEVNSGPGFRMHLAPSRGQARNVAEPVLKMLFPEGAPCRIPIVAVTGTNGKTTTTRLVAHIAKTAGHSVGFTTTDGIYINDQEIHRGDCSGPASAEAVLNDPIVDFAVLECARGGILRSGLAFDKCDVAIVTNVTGDHLGIDGIDNLEDLARVKSVVPRTVTEDGYAILNADDDIVYSMKDELDCRIALFSTRDDNEKVIEHCNRGGIAAVVEKGYFAIWKGEWRMRIARVKDVPLTLDGMAVTMVKNVLPAILAATIRDFDIRTVRQALQTFIPGPDQLPGRMNIFRFAGFKVMVDYAHNTDGFAQLAGFMKLVDSPQKIGVIGCPGDRRGEDIEEMGFLSAGMFDEIIIRHDKNGRGRSNDEITGLIRRGINRKNAANKVWVVSDEIEAIRYAISRARKGAFIAVSCEDVRAAIEFLKAGEQVAMVSDASPANH